MILNDKGTASNCKYLTYINREGAMRTWMGLALLLAFVVGAGAAPRSVVFEEFGRYN